MLRRLYDWTIARASHAHAPRWLAAISFAEASFFPIPPDALLAPMCLARPERALRYAALCTAGSVLGALLGYAIGYFLFAAVGRPIIDFYGAGADFESFRASFNEQGWLVVFLAGFTPLPFKVITIAAGSTAMALPILVGASLVSRAARFFLVAGLLARFGAPMKAWIESHFALATTVGGLLFVGGFLALKLVL